MTELEGALLAGVLDRMVRPDYPAFEAQLRSSGYCAQPVRLKGRVEVCDGHGRRQQVWTTDTEPDGLLRKACGNRREAVCAPCAQRYRADAWQLIAAGLRGGKGVPDTVVGHPAIFATLTAPSFGPVHAHLLDRHGRPRRCRPRRDAPVCPHGNRLSCGKTHGPDDACLGEPLCPECFDYGGAVVWNNLLGELWRRTTIYLPRQLAGLVGMTQKRLHELVRVSYVKVAEYQARGLVHIHVLIRLDRRMPAYRTGEVRPPESRFTTRLLEDALRATAEHLEVTIPDELGAGAISWGAQLDVEQLGTDLQERRRRAGYLAKYSTKSTEQAGGLVHRIHPNDIEHANVSDHVRRYLLTSFELHDQVTDAIRANPTGEDAEQGWCAPAPATSRFPNDLALRMTAAMSTDERLSIRLHDGREFVGTITRRSPDGLVLDTGPRVAMAEVRAITTAPPQPAKRDRRDRRLAACAHTFGYRGHCLTKSRHWSTTFTAQRQAREQHVREQLRARGDQIQQALAEHTPEQRISTFEFAGVGHLTTADAYLAAKAAAKAREHRELAREALAPTYNPIRRDLCGAPQDPPMPG
ncbi:MAG: replication initiator [Solirubrobacteraceae bacterium]